MAANGISVILCCYNSASRLPETLRHLSLQKTPDFLEWELVMIDNASVDNSARIAETEWLKLNSPGIDFQILHEAKPGLSHARDKGIRNARFDFVIFCDDDNWLADDYVLNAYRTISKNPGIAAVGGQSAAVSNTDLPDWFAGSQTNYAVGKQAEQSGSVNFRKHLWGSGIVIRKNLYNRAFDTFPSLLTGRRGSELSSGEDSEMCMRFMLMGYELHYAEDLKFMHFISAERLTREYNSRLVDGFLKAHEILKVYAKFIDFREMPAGRRYLIFIKSFARYLITAVSKTKRWNLSTEQMNIFFSTGIILRTLPVNENRIRQFIKQSH